MKEPRVAECEDCGYLKWIYHSGMDVCDTCWDIRTNRHRFDSPHQNAVYFIQGVTNDGRYRGLIKIGKTHEPEERLIAIQKMVRRRLEIIGLEFGGYEREVELHEMFSAERAYLEWFRPSNRLLDYIFNSTLGIDEFLEVRHMNQVGINNNNALYDMWGHALLHKYGAWQVVTRIRPSRLDDVHLAIITDCITKLPQEYPNKIPTLPFPQSMFNPSVDELSEVQLPLFDVQEVS